MGEKPLEQEGFLAHFFLFMYSYWNPTIFPDYTAIIPDVYYEIGKI
jgi:hypothetical protein